MADKKNSENVPPPEERFMANVEQVIALMQEITEACEKKGINIVSSMVIGLVGLYVASKEPTHIIDTFIKKSHKHWETIRNKEKDFFLKQSLTVFGDLPTNHVEAFTEFFAHKDTVSATNMESLWEFFHALVKIAIKYIHARRRPGTRLENGRTVSVYENRFFDEIDVNKAATDWSITLNF